MIVIKTALNAPAIHASNVSKVDKNGRIQTQNGYASVCSAHQQLINTHFNL